MQKNHKQATILMQKNHKQATILMQKTHKQATILMQKKHKQATIFYLQTWVALNTGAGLDVYSASDVWWLDSSSHLRLCLYQISI